MTRLVLLLAVVLAGCAQVAAPRPAPQLGLTKPEATPTIPVVGSEERTGAPPTPTPRPSGGIGQPASYCKPGYCETPAPPQRSVTGRSGQATWWDTFGSGYYVALRPDLGSKGDLVIVCGGEPFHCVTAPVITSCACLGPNSDRLVDLSADLFREFAPLSAGVVRITLQVVGGKP